VLTEDKGFWTVTHVSNAAAFHRLLLSQSLSGSAIYTGKKGYYFLETGETTWWGTSHKQVVPQFSGCLKSCKSLLRKR
jgi:hypothetical protein